MNGDRLFARILVPEMRTEIFRVALCGETLNPKYKPLRVRLVFRDESGNHRDDEIQLSVDSLGLPTFEEKYAMGELAGMTLVQIGSVWQDQTEDQVDLEAEGSQITFTEEEAFHFSARLYP